MSTPEDPLIIRDVAAWRAWLDANEDASDGEWLALAKKGTTEPTTLTYQDALVEALCSGWIDGQVKRFDEAMFVQRFTPRRKRSVWSARNVGIVQQLTDEGRMRARGLNEVERAQADGRWDRAYAGSKDATVPADLEAAITASPAATATWERLNAANRFAVLYPLMTAASDDTRARRLAKSLAMLERGDTPHPQ